MSFLTYKFRIKDARAGKALTQYATACNQVWNFCVATQREAERRRKGGGNVRWPTAFDLINLTGGTSKEFGILADTIGAICRQFVASRDQVRRCPRFRSSFGPKRALGWVPFPARAVKRGEDFISYLKRPFRYWNSRQVEGEFKSGCFVQDARGRWYVTFQCEVADRLAPGNGSVGIDLGLKEFATLSDGRKIPALQHYRQHEGALAIAQRAGNKRRARAINAKIRNARRHHLHEQSTRIVRENSLIVVGNVNAAAMKKTRMAKSVADAGWSVFRSQLCYKARRHGAVFIEANERFSSQTCSMCGSLPSSRPRGIAGLGIRHWECSDCGASHDRDVNAARNILRAGLERQPPAGVILSPEETLTLSPLGFQASLYPSCM